jgi:hypothetical protein
MTLIHKTGAAGEDVVIKFSKTGVSLKILAVYYSFDGTPAGVLKIETTKGGKVFEIDITAGGMVPLDFEVNDDITVTITGTAGVTTKMNVQVT